MGILKFISILGMFCLFGSCSNKKYKKSEESFQGIYLREWNSFSCPRKIVFEKYQKDSNFKVLLETNSGFEIKGCEKTAVKLNQRIFIPNVAYLGKINYDIKIIIDDSLEYKLNKIKNNTDTIYAGGNAWIIMNNISSLMINGYKKNNSNAPANIDIPTCLGRIIKKETK